MPREYETYIATDSLSMVWELQSQIEYPPTPFTPMEEHKRKITRWLNSKLNQQEIKMKKDEMLQGNYLKAADLQGQSVPVVIRELRQEEMQDGQKKFVLYFNGKDRGLVLNKTNTARLFEYVADDSDDWPGQRINLVPTKVDYKGDLVDAVRIHSAD